MLAPSHSCSRETRPRLHLSSLPTWLLLAGTTLVAIGFPLVMAALCGRPGAWGRFSLPSGSQWKFTAGKIIQKWGIGTGHDLEMFEYQRAKG